MDLAGHCKVSFSNSYKSYDKKSGRKYIACCYNTNNTNTTSALCIHLIDTYCKY